MRYSLTSISKANQIHTSESEFNAFFFIVEVLSNDDELRPTSRHRASIVKQNQNYLKSQQYIEQRTLLLDIVNCKPDKLGDANCS